MEYRQVSCVALLLSICSYDFIMLFVEYWTVSAGPKILEIYLELALAIITVKHNYLYIIICKDFQNHLTYKSTLSAKARYSYSPSASAT